MPDPTPVDYSALPSAPNPVLKEQGIEEAFIQRLGQLEYHYHPANRGRASLEARKKRII